MLLRPQSIQTVCGHERAPLEASENIKAWVCIPSHPTLSRSPGILALSKSFVYRLEGFSIPTVLIMIAIYQSDHILHTFIGHIIMFVRHTPVGRQGPARSPLTLVYSNQAPSTLPRAWPRPHLLRNPPKPARTASDRGPSGARGAWEPPTRVRLLAAG